MGYQPDEFDDSWADLVPQQPKRRDRLPVLLAGGAVALVLICLCGISGYILLQEFILKSEPAQNPALPTLPGSEPATPVDLDSTINTPESESIDPSTSAVALPPTPAVFPSATSILAPTATIIDQAVEPADPLIESNLQITMLPDAPVIDGHLDEWAGLPAYQSSFLVFQVAGWDGSDDLIAIWRLAWDMSNLYVGVEVADDLHVQNQTGNQLFRGDSVDMQFDTNRDGDYGDDLSPDDFQITFSPGDFISLPASAARFQGTASGQILDAPGGHHLTVQAQQSVSGYTLEAAIPWSDLNLVPGPGLVIGLALNASDNDSQGTAVQEVMKSNIATRTLTDPTSWGTLTLR